MGRPTGMPSGRPPNHRKRALRLLEAHAVVAAETLLRQVRLGEPEALRIYFAIIPLERKPPE